jgi:pyruvate,water dikinase
MAIQVERAFGGPQDIERAYADGRCNLLQSRPLTAIPEEKHSPASAQPRRYSRMQRGSVLNAVDHFPLPPYPFDNSLFFRPMIERLGGVTAALGFAPIAVDEMLVEMADGVYQVMPNLRPALGVLKLPVKLLAALRVKQDAWLAERRATLVVLAQQIDAEELSPLTDQELLERMERLQRLLLDLFFPRFVAFPRGMLFRKGLSLLARLAVGERAGQLEGELLAEIPCTTIAINQGLNRLADRIGASAELRQVFRGEHPGQIPARLRESIVGRDLLAELEDFLRQYGYRESTMLGSAFPGWRDIRGSSTGF